ncbi:MAG: GGDEF domain-containing protein [Proteobacteria bacterium]|nr:GGDEF domain-containing protein [Pseudomonadota bacterium]
MTNQTDSCSNCETLRHQLEEKDKEILTLLSQIADLVRNDDMTGTLNRHGWEELLHTELQRSQRTGHPFCVAVIRLDDFQGLLEREGIPAGETALKTASETMLRILRTLDRVGHFGGANFGILLPATWLDQGAIALRRLTDGIAACRHGSALSFSAGLTTNAFGDTVQRITHRAATAMEQASQQGGNRVVQVEETLPDAAP